MSSENLLLVVAGRVDDDLLTWARELVALGDDARAVDLLAAALIADQVVLPAPARAAVVAAARARRSVLDADATLAPAADEKATPHVFEPPQDGPETAAVVAAVHTLLRRPDVRGRAWLSWRRTPTGSAPGPLPRPVVLLELAEGPVAVLAGELAAALERVDVPASIEVFTPDTALPEYHLAARRVGRPLEAPGLDAGTGPADPADLGEPDGTTPAPSGKTLFSSGSPDDAAGPQPGPAAQAGRLDTDRSPVGDQPVVSAEATLGAGHDDLGVDLGADLRDDILAVDDVPPATARWARRTARQPSASDDSQSRLFAPPREHDEPEAADEPSWAWGRAASWVSQDQSSSAAVAPASSDPWQEPSPEPAAPGWDRDEPEPGRHGVAAGRTRAGRPHSEHLDREPTEDESRSTGGHRSASVFGAASSPADSGWWAATAGHAGGHDMETADREPAPVAPIRRLRPVLGDDHLAAPGANPGGANPEPHTGRWRALSEDAAPLRHLSAELTGGIPVLPRPVEADHTAHRWPEETSAELPARPRSTDNGLPTRLRPETGGVLPVRTRRPVDTGDGFAARSRASGAHPDPLAAPRPFDAGAPPRLRPGAAGPGQPVAPRSVRAPGPGELPVRPRPMEPANGHPMPSRPMEPANGHPMPSRPMEPANGHPMPSRPAERSGGHPAQPQRVESSGSNPARLRPAPRPADVDPLGPPSHEQGMDASGHRGGADLFAPPHAGLGDPDPAAPPRMPTPADGRMRRPPAPPAPLSRPAPQAAGRRPLPPHPDRFGTRAPFRPGPPPEPETAAVPDGEVAIDSTRLGLHPDAVERLSPTDRALLARLQREMGLRPPTRPAALLRPLPSPGPRAQPVPVEPPDIAG